MKIQLYLIISLLGFISCNETPSPILNEGIDVESPLLITMDSIVEKNDATIQFIMTSSSSTEPAKEVLINGIDFTIVEDANKNITYWSTNDKKFKTPEGFQVGMTYKELPRNLQFNMNKENGWGYSILLNSGWQLGFCEGYSCTDTDPTSESQVKWIFKR